MKITRKQVAEEMEKVLDEGFFSKLFGKKKKEDPAADEAEDEVEEDLTPAWEQAIEDAAWALAQRDVWKSRELHDNLKGSWFLREIGENAAAGAWNQGHFEDALRKTFHPNTQHQPMKTMIEYLKELQKAALDARDKISGKRPTKPQRDEDEWEWRGGDLRRKKVHTYESKDNSMGKLLENWRSYKKKVFLTEKADPDKVDPKRFPTKLSDVHPKNSKFVTRSGTKDGTEDDDTVGVTPGKTFPVNKLNPSQSSMNIGKALAQALAMIQGDMNLGGDLGAFISNDGHIMDGHHRWIATTMVDPTKEVGGFLVDFPSDQLIAALNAITKGRLGIQKGKPATGGFKQFEEAPIRQQLQTYLAKGIPGKFPKTPEYVQQALEKFTGQDGEGALNAAVAAFVKNLQTVKPFKLPSSAPTRPNMPVIDPDMVPGALKTAINALTKGELDLNPPYGGAKTRKSEKDKQQESMSKASIKKLVLEVINKRDK